MRTLEDEIEDLERLDQLRIQSAELRDQGRKALRKAGLEWERPSPMDNALVVKALCDRKEGPPSHRVEELEKPPNASGTPPRLSILLAARSMQALAAAPASAFSEALLNHYYEIVRELYTADQPDWRFGGARAAVKGSASAFVTGECVRAILGFSRTLKNTGDFVNEVRSFTQRRNQLQEYSSRWCKIELNRLRCDFRTTVVRLLDNLAIDLELPMAGNTPRPTAKWLDEFIDSAPAKIKHAVARVVATFEVVISRVDKRRKTENQDARFERSETGHVVALKALAKGKAAATEAAALSLIPGSALDNDFERLSKLFWKVAEDVRRVIHPARCYLSTVLDRELTSASSQARPRWDPAEMAFAAASYGFAANFQDERLRRAGLCLSEELSERGHFRSGSPFHVEPDGTEVGVSGANVLSAFAQLLEHVEEIPVDEGLTKRMMLFFNDTKKSFRGEPDYYGWSEQTQETTQPSPRDTVFSVIALDRINRMLDARINGRVFRHFSVKRDTDLKVPSLKKLFYPDYGLRHHDDDVASNNSWADEQPVALVLERMRTHVLGLSQYEKASVPLFSLILYGPPGTGKTTFVEALAKSAEVPLVEITPSDIVSSGADVVERRARVVFKALALLTRAIILFDEFDPVLKRRNPDEKQPTVFSFVTPGMLPKLKALHEKAKRRGVAYVLVTNLISVLDGAAIRPGRFDCKLGIFPPDPLSRKGRLLDEVQAFRRLRSKAPQLRDDSDQWPDNLVNRVDMVIQQTGGAQMEALTREGWFRHPEHPDEIPAASPFEYLIGWRDDPPTIEQLEDEPESASPKAKADSESAKAAKRERLQRTWITEWEEQVRKATSHKLNELIEKPPVELVRQRNYKK